MFKWDNVEHQVTKEYVFVMLSIYIQEILEYGP